MSDLPEPGSPLVLPDGTMIDPTSGKVIKEEAQETMVEVPNNQRAVREITAVRRRLNDLPDVPQKMNTLSVVLTYSLYGLDNRDIAIATGLTEDQVEIIKSQDAYKTLTNEIIESIMAQDEDDIRTQFRLGAKRAAQRMREWVDADSDMLALTAAKDLLDRDGHRPADVVEHRHRIEGGLAIELIKTDKTQEVPVIDVTPVHVED